MQRSSERNKAYIYLSPPEVGERERALLLEAFDSGWIAPLGPHLDRFEALFAERHGSPDAVGLSSGTASLHLALRAIGVEAGDVLLVSTSTFAATANVGRYEGAELVFVDSDSRSWNMDPDRLGEAIDECVKRGRIPKAAIVVDLYGQCADYDRLREHCAPLGIPIVEDAAEALGATYKGKPAGTLGAFGAFSFNGNKMITTSGGGMLIGKDPEALARARKLASQAREPRPYYEHAELGYNYRMSNLLAALGIAQLERLDEKIEKRRRLRARYREALGRYDGLSFMPEADYGRSNAWLTCALLGEGLPDPETARRHFEARGIEVRQLWKPMHRQPLYADCRVYGGVVSERLFERGLCLPSGIEAEGADFERVLAAWESLLAGRIFASGGEKYSAGEDGEDRAA